MGKHSKPGLKDKGHGVPDGKVKKKVAPKIVSESDHPSSKVTLLESKRKELSAQLLETEKKIYDLETKYLETSSVQGNALRGYEGLLQGKDSNKRLQLKPDDRIFSGSSLTGTLHLKQ